MHTKSPRGSSYRLHEGAHVVSTKELIKSPRGSSYCLHKGAHYVSTRELIWYWWIPHILQTNSNNYTIHARVYRTLTHPRAHTQPHTHTSNHAQTHPYHGSTQNNVQYLNRAHTQWYVFYEIDKITITVSLFRKREGKKNIYTVFISRSSKALIQKNICIYRKIFAVFISRSSKALIQKNICSKQRRNMIQI